MRPCVYITLAATVIALVIWIIYSNISWQLMSNRLDNHRICIDANEHRV